MYKLLTILTALSFSLSSMAQLPYNPDQDSNGIISASDLLGFLTVYGQEFDSDDVVPIANGGTEAPDINGAKVNLKIAMFMDTTLSVMGFDEAYGWIDGGVASPASVAMGENVSAPGDFSQAFGSNTTASGDFSTSQNRFSNASGTCSHASGEGTTASGTAAHAEGFQSVATALAAHAEGYGTLANSDYAHSQNRNTTASANCAHAEGEATTASGVASHSEGFVTQAQGLGSHSEGFETVAGADYAHAENQNTQALGIASHAEGKNTIASGFNSHAEGNLTVASASNSSAAGNNTVADQTDMTAIGRFNVESQAGALFAVGNGTSDIDRNNAFWVGQDGNATLQGTLQVGSGVKIAGEDVMTLIAALEQANSDLQAQVDALEALVDTLIEGAQPDGPED